MKTVKLKILLFLLVFIFSSFYEAYALDNSYYQDNDIQFFSKVGTSSSNCDVLLPVINDEDQLVTVINKYIKDKVGTKSPFYNHGDWFVRGAKAAGINPFIALAISLKESSLGTANNKNWFTWAFPTQELAKNTPLDSANPPTVETFNGFGRTAGESQPSAWYYSHRYRDFHRVYKWSSWEDSLTGEDNFFVYFNRRYIQEGKTTLEDIINVYAPADDHNDPNGYTSFLKNQLQDLNNRAGDSITCNLFSSGGLNLERARTFMSFYKSSSDSASFISGTDTTCLGGVLANCTSFSVYFIKKYTYLNWSGNSGDGKDVAGLINDRNSSIVVDSIPEVFSVFSRNATERSPHGHTGVVLGIDTNNDKIIIGEASCGDGLNGIRAYEDSLSIFKSGSYVFAHIAGDGKVKTDLVNRDAGV